MELMWNSPAQAKQWVRDFTPTLTRPSLVLLAGTLGAGKTQVVKWFLHEMGVNSTTVTSPTYAIHHQYTAPSGPVDHVDLYRLNGDDDLNSSGFWDLLQQPHGLVFVEWSDRLPDSVWPRAWQRTFLTLEKMPDESRRVRLR